MKSIYCLLHFFGDPPEQLSYRKLVKNSDCMTRSELQETELEIQLRGRIEFNWSMNYTITSLLSTVLHCTVHQCMNLPRGQ